MVATFQLSPGSSHYSAAVLTKHLPVLPVKVSTATTSGVLLVNCLFGRFGLSPVVGCQSSMGDQGEDTAQYSIRPPDSAKFRAGAVKVRMQHFRINASLLLF